jgi:DNA (cytosine-5)-methyltransferase 1
MPRAARWLRANHRWKIVEEDLKATTPRELMKAAKLRKRKVDLISAGPPCQPFSKSANWSPNGLRRLHDPRAAALHNLMDIIGYVLPRCVLIENVEGFRRGGLASSRTSLS